MTDPTDSEVEVRSNSSAGISAALGQDDADQHEALRLKYCPPLDDALFYAIVSEYELPRDQNALESVLESLRSGALDQDSTDFDPSGTGGRFINQNDDNNPDASGSSAEDSLFNGVTSITTGISELLGADSDRFGTDLSNASAEAKTDWLLNMFPVIPKRELAEVLRSHDGSLDKATDELLNLSFLAQAGNDQYPEDEPVPKGIEAFAEENIAPRKGRRKRKNRPVDVSRASSASSHLTDQDTSSYNVWSTMSEDVKFICTRTTLQQQTVRSAYHQHGARLGPTIRELAIRESTTTDQCGDETAAVMDMQIAEFEDEFEQVPKSQLIGLLKMARNIPSAARELIEAMVSSDNNRYDEPKSVSIAPQYAPVEIDETDGNVHKFSSPSTSTWASKASGTGSGQRQAAAAHRIAASHHFGQASVAFKKSKSDRLMGGAAAYYSQVGHEQMRKAKEMQAAEADALVGGQSSSTVLDLHGVSVADALRITSDRVQSWWDGLGDTKYMLGGAGGAAMRKGFRIVTGVGSHSKNHAPKIGPAVSRMLLKDGWKVEIGHGELTVTGRARKK
ncbi:hypothetical protein PV10_06487 [Exophiala mesophila]|uniref:Smr domain-containing protein n=1 Tax=Exophiala mesophila TaxID=212818 RepID=A0A0D1ZBG5_EXOME|nr:uncharacterized protein PV10_06487 [Exophiala mesophila]KIV92007.1 hypothetical protein PV10_06487 [Exophiala mesophila]